MLHKENCQYKVLSRVYYVNYDELVKKIETGAVLPHDPVKIGNSVWTDAEKIPEFAKIFEQNNLRNKLPEGADFENIFTHFQVKESHARKFDEFETLLEKACSVHPDKPPYYVCTICENLFCRNCPPKGTENDLICPFCGGKCALYMERVWKFENKKPESVYKVEAEETAAPPEKKIEVVYTKLKFEDFVNALIYPFRFPLDLLVCGILFSVLVLGQIVTLFKGGGMLFATLAITTIVLILKFGVLAKTFENLSYKDEKRRSYLPHMGKFTLWEDFVNPFLLGINAYLVSFGFFIILTVVSGVYAWSTFAADNAIIEKEMLESDRQVNSVLLPDQSAANATNQQSELRKMINNSRLKRMESIFGTNHLADNEQLATLFKSVTRLTLRFQMPICFALVWGIIFFPAICLSTGENHFLSLKTRFLAGFKTMRDIGFDYVKILFMCLVLVMCSLMTIYALSYLFSMLQMPVAEVFSAIVAGSFLVFYFWLAFSFILGKTLFNKETIEGQ